MKSKPDITLVFPKSPFLINDGVYPPLGILYLSSYLQQFGFDVQCIDMGLGQEVDPDTTSDIIGVSITTPQRFEAFELAHSLKKHGKTLVAGGPHATHMADECKQQGFDHVVLGYGEAPLARLLCGLYEKHVDVPEPDLSNPPMPDRWGLPMKAYTYKIDGRPATAIMTSRGCRYNCSYCAKLDRRLYAQSADRTLQEIYGLHDDLGYTAFMIFDDVFIIDKDRLQIMAKALSGSPFIFRCFARVDLIDPNTAALMRQMGIVEAGLGIESGSDRVLRKSHKGTTRQMNTNAVRLLRDNGIRVKAFIIVGLPEETPETVKRTETWLDEAKPDDVDISVYQPLPGSPIFRNPDKFNVTFAYNSNPLWFKGTPGKYVAAASTEGLSAVDVVRLRDDLEFKFKSPEKLV